MLRALVVGIDNYPGSPLSGCVNDATRMRDALERHENGNRNFDCKLLTAPGEQITKAVLRDNLRSLFEQPADAALFYFAGHGTADNLGGYLVTQDISSYDDGLPMRDILDMAAPAPIREIVLILDCCYSGNLGNAPKRGNANAEAVLREGISVLTASRDTETSTEADDGGLFTSLVVAALDGGAADVLGRVTVPSIYSFVDQAMGAWDQRPLLKSHVSHLISLRQCRPSVTMEDLRRLPEFFPNRDDVHPLDPSYEPTEEPKGHPNEKILETFQQYRDARLLVPVDAPALYWACMKRTGCELTPSGMFYWHLAKENKL